MEHRNAVDSPGGTPMIPGPGEGGFAAMVIDGAERRGMARMLEAGLFPSETFPDRAVFERLGFLFGAPMDDLFVTCTLPEGWSWRPCSKPTHAHVVDAAGNARVEVFVKDVRYDRKAHVALVERYDILPVRGPGTHAGVTLVEGERALSVRDRGVAVAVFEPVLPSDQPAGSPRRSPWDDRARARAWLDANRPGHDDPVASWADPAGRP